MTLPFKPFAPKYINTLVMEKDLENSDWMNEAPYLAGLGAKSPFALPEGYFEQLPEQIHQAIYLDKLKAGLPESGFNTPEGYFEGLATGIQAKLAIEKLKEQVPNEGYTVPADYFNQLQSKISDRITQENTGRRETKIVRLWHSKLLKYASAACFILITAAGIYFYPGTPAQQALSADMANEQLLYDIDESTIIEHIESNSLKRENPAVADADLENYILSNYSQNDIASDL
ncbi:hypothetical protein SAMN04488522_103802 [Pedobacter caeni]|uniref:Uncharacterized protein n=2 Tax=Pedobacter caeni TaxID=288992 RepID=A0A1M5EU70_9SPHI|nr:hypothetical protein SAMN04488522_103802 [Pedobacter caeni]